MNENKKPILVEIQPKLAVHVEVNPKQTVNVELAEENTTIEFDYLINGTIPDFELIYKLAKA